MTASYQAGTEPHAELRSEHGDDHDTIRRSNAAHGENVTSILTSHRGGPRIRHEIDEAGHPGTTSGALTRGG